MTFFRTTGLLILREVTRIGHDHSLLLTLLIAPVLYLFFYGSIYINKAEQSVKLAVVDLDQSALSRLLTQQINDLQMVDVVLAGSLQHAEEAMQAGSCQGFLHISKGLEANVLSFHPADVQLAVNAARFLPSSDLIGSVTEICLAVCAGVRMEYYEMKGLTSSLSLNEALPVNLDYRPLYNDRSSYGAFLLPGLLMLILQQTLLIGLAESIAAERMKKSFAEWIRLAHGRIFTALAGKGGFYLMLYAVYALFALTNTFSVFQVPMRGDWHALALCLILFLITLIPMAIWIGSLFRSQLISLQVLAFSSYPIFLITGYSWPLEMLPWGIRALSSLLPTTPFMKAYISITQQGGSLSDNLPAIGHLMLLLLFYSAICWFRISRLSLRDSDHTIAPADVAS